LKEKKEQNETKEEMLAGGGPVQRAMELDLMELRPKFLEQLTNISQQHDSPGCVFGSFRRVFGEAKVALVHTRTVPVRCDRDAYSQLLYSACLSLLKQPFQQDNLVLEHAIFAVFCLYALYETNTLLHASPESPLQMLSLGVQCLENPKLLYRRTYRLPIRIDRYHFSLLQRVRDEALAQQADCQRARMQAWSGTTADWSCTCGIAVDAVHVVDRIMPCLDFGEYTGPIGLEGLAGHADYPYGCMRPKKAKGTPAPKANVIDLTDQDLDRVMGAVQEPMDDLTDSVERYRSSLQAIRLPPVASNQATRIRDALNPIFDQSSEPPWQEVLERISTEDNTEGAQKDISVQGPETRVSTRVIRSITRNEGSKVPCAQEKKSAPTHESPVEMAVDDEVSFQLLLPSDLPEALQDGIQEAVNSAIASGETLIELETAEREASSAWSQNGVGAVEVGPERSVTTDKGHAADGGVSVFSNASGQAGAALRTLLSAVSERNPTVNRLPVAIVQSERDASDVTSRRFGNTFLTMCSDLMQDYAPLEHDDSDISSVSSDESIASADVGQKAIRALLSAVHGVGKKRRSANGSSKRKASPNKMSTRNSKKPAAARKRSDESDDQSLTSIREQGKAALDALLSQVVLVRGDALLPQVALDQREDEEDEDPIKASPVEIIPRKSNKPASRKRPEDNDDMSLHSIQELGKTALNALFSQVVALDQADDEEDEEDEDVFSF
jgi:hypothetical protein